MLAAPVAIVHDIKPIDMNIRTLAPTPPHVTGQFTIGRCTKSVVFFKSKRILSDQEVAEGYLMGFAPPAPPQNLWKIYLPIVLQTRGDLTLSKSLKSNQITFALLMLHKKQNVQMIHLRSPSKCRFLKGRSHAKVEHLPSHAYQRLPYE